MHSSAGSCHCGPQSTVVHRRVRQLNLLDLQRSRFVFGIQCGGKSLPKLIFCFSLTKGEAAQDELGSAGPLLFVPEDVDITACAGVLTVQCDCLVFCCYLLCFWLQHMVFLCSAFYKTNSIKLLSVNQTHVSKVTERVVFIPAHRVAIHTKMNRGVMLRKCELQPQ